MDINQLNYDFDLSPPSLMLLLISSLSFYVPAGIACFPSGGLLFGVIVSY